jgi:serine/threonine-protein kinase
VFLVMELLEGETVEARRTRSEGRIPVVEALDCGERILDVLAVAHEHGVVHRDIKPDNVFLTQRGELKILDFGIARLLDGTGATRSGEFLGTPGFMSPEQANGRTREIDERTDVWAAGAVLFTLISGSEVHEAATRGERLVYAATQPVRPVRTLVPWLEPALAAVIDRALAFDRGARWQSARAMQEALRATPSFAQCLRFRAGMPAPNTSSALVPEPRTLIVGTGPSGTLVFQPPTGSGSGPGRRGGAR